MSTIQTWITGVFLVIITLLTVRQPIRAELLAISKKDWGIILLSSLAYSASWVFFFLALKHGPLAKIIAIERLDLVVTIFLSALFFGEQITLNVLAGAALMLCGVYLITQNT
jgi:transporter family protein